MTYAKTLPLLGLFAVSLGACSNSDDAGNTAEVAVDTSPPAVTFKPKGEATKSVKPFAPVRIAYKVLGSPTSASSGCGGS